MPIYTSNGSTNLEIKKLYTSAGADNREIKNIFVSNGSTMLPVWKGGGVNEFIVSHDARNGNGFLTGIDTETMQLKWKMKIGDLVDVGVGNKSGDYVVRTANRPADVGWCSYVNFHPNGGSLPGDLKPPPYQFSEDVWLSENCDEYFGISKLFCGMFRRVNGIWEMVWYYKIPSSNKIEFSRNNLNVFADGCVFYITKTYVIVHGELEDYVKYTNSYVTSQKIDNSLRNSGVPGYAICASQDGKYVYTISTDGKTVYKCTSDLTVVAQKTWTQAVSFLRKNDATLILNIGVGMNGTTSIREIHSISENLDNEIVLSKITGGFVGKMDEDLFSYATHNGNVTGSRHAAVKLDKSGNIIGRYNFLDSEYTSPDIYGDSILRSPNSTVLSYNQNA